jgi:hypothetical protein
LTKTTLAQSYLLKAVKKPTSQSGVRPQNFKKQAAVFNLLQTSRF